MTSQTPDMICGSFSTPGLSIHTCRVTHKPQLIEQVNPCHSSLLHFITLIIIVITLRSSRISQWALILTLMRRLKASLTWCRCRAGQSGSRIWERKRGWREPGTPPRPGWAAAPWHSRSSWRTRSLPAWPADSSTGNTGNRWESEAWAEKQVKRFMRITKRKQSIRTMNKEAFWIHIWKWRKVPVSLQMILACGLSFSKTLQAQCRVSGPPPLSRSLLLYSCSPGGRPEGEQMTTTEHKWNCVWQGAAERGTQSQLWEGTHQVKNGHKQSDEHAQQDHKQSQRDPGGHASWQPWYPLNTRGHLSAPLLKWPTTRRKQTWHLLSWTAVGAND